MYDIDPQETKEWLESFEDIIAREGLERAKFIINNLLKKSNEIGINITPLISKKKHYFINSIKLSDQLIYPGNLEIEETIEKINRWNAMIMVTKTNKKDPSLGGHIGSGASIITLYEVGFNHFFHANSDTRLGDLIFYQGHSTPVIYARSFLEKRLTEKQLNNFRQQAFNKDEGLSSYPHPYLQPNYWQFATVSMGLGPLQAIYQARFMKYLESRNLAKKKNRKVWLFCGDGEMDEPESLGAINRASREGLDNLIFVINCNLQRLDGLIDGNGKIIDEFYRIFNGAKWNVIKVLWSSYWDSIFLKDTNSKLKDLLSNMNDGEMQFHYAHKNFKKIILNNVPELKEEDFTDECFSKMYGGHDPIKIYSAYEKARNNNNGYPTVILAMTVKGYGLGAWGESKNIAHNVKMLDNEALQYISKRFNINIDKKKIDDLEYLTISPDSKESIYLHKKRELLGGYIPSRIEYHEKLHLPHYLEFYDVFEHNIKKQYSTTQCFIKIFTRLHKHLKDRLVPITVDESRTFGMEGLFSTLGIYNHKGQKYIPEDKSELMFYKESKKGQIIQDGINESGGFCSWLASATSYSVHGFTTIPFYIYYSMFGFQRFGDLAWLAGDSHAKGFLLGGTSGRTTLNGEGLQHQDGHSHIQAGLIPSCISYDPTYGFELAVIIWSGLKRMYQMQEKIFYYITLMNEKYFHKSMPDGVEQDIIKGLYLLKKYYVKEDNKKKVNLLGSGAILREIEIAGEMLKKHFNVSSNIWSMTSANELYRDGKKIQRWNVLHPDITPKKTHIQKCFENEKGPVVVSTDYIQLYTEQLREFMPDNYITLGTDGFGRSDMRKSLRHFFKIDRYYIIISALHGLFKEGSIDASLIKKAIKQYNIDPDRLDPTYPFS